MSDFHVSTETQPSTFKIKAAIKPQSANKYLTKFRNIIILTSEFVLKTEMKSSGWKER